MTKKCIYIYHNFKYSNKFERVPPFFNVVGYLTLGTFNVLIIQTDCVLLRCDQFCFGGTAMFTNYQP